MIKKFIITQVRVKKQKEREERRNSNTAHSNENP